jgi:xanthine dehydrogenase accessory factor
MDRIQQTTGIYEKIVEFIDSSRSFAVALVLRTEGSTPRQAGVRAVIDRTGKIWGTIGGGVVEAEAQRLAVKACQSKQPIIFEQQLHGAKSTDEIPICGGMMRILIDPTVGKHRTCYAHVTEAIRVRGRGVLMTTVRNTTNAEVSCHWFEQDAIPPDVTFPGLQNIRSCLDRETVQLFTESSHAFTEVLVEPLIPEPLLLIAGGGHVGQALTCQANLVGFDVTVIDERPEFTDPALFPAGTRTYCGDMAKQIATLVADDTYVVIVTRGHKLDAKVLEACIHRPAAYVGMIGSKRKVALMREHFIESGLATEAEFDRVFTPIGLNIGAVTVPEIATSITAELIAVRRKGIAHKVRDEEESS